MKHHNIHLHGLDIIDIYTKSIVKMLFLYDIKTHQYGTFFSFNIRMFIYMVWTREIYTIILQNEIFFIKPLIKSYMECKICKNVLWYTHRLKHIIYTIEKIYVITVILLPGTSGTCLISSFIGKLKINTQILIIFYKRFGTLSHHQYKMK